jgi:uncharacterized damage-inducible protein DinB
METYGGKELAKSFRTVRGNTVQIAVDIPESKYDFVAASGTRSVAELLKHIAFGPALYEDMHRVKRLTTLQGYDFPGLVARSKAEEQKPRPKAAIVELLGSEGERFAAWLATLTPQFLAESYTDPMGQNPRTRLESLLSPKEHEMHHRGQLMLIERMLGIVPHLTRQMEERIKARAAAAGSPAAH